MFVKVARGVRGLLRLLLDPFGADRVNGDSFVNCQILIRCLNTQLTCARRSTAANATRRPTIRRGRGSSGCGRQRRDRRGRVNVVLTVLMTCFSDGGLFLLVRDGGFQGLLGQTCLNLSDCGANIDHDLPTYGILNASDVCLYQRTLITSASDRFTSAIITRDLVRFYV